MKKTLAAVLIAILVVLAVYWLTVAVGVWAWNLVIPVLFAGPVISFETAAGILVLLSIISLIFGGNKR